MKRLRNFSLGAVLLLSLITTSGCVPLIVGAAVGAGSMIYLQGALVQNVSHTVEEVHEAALDAFKEMELFVTADELNRRSAVIHAEYAGGRKVKVFVDALTERASKITIRVGAFGDEEESLAILNTIQNNL